MSTPIDMQPPNGQQRHPRRGKKPKNTNRANGAASPSSQYPAPPQAVYDGSSEPTASPVSHRKQHRHPHASDTNGYAPNNNYQKQTNRAGGPSQSFSIPQQGPQGTPVKSTAYAGPTFHASPAASSLPMPKMFSKSLPESSATLPAGLVAEDSDLGQTDLEDSQTNTLTPEPKYRDPSPLDFLFDAARKARDSSSDLRSPEIKSGNLSPSSISRPTSGNETPTNRTSAMFPMELDGSNTPANSIGPSFATPFRDRMNAYRSQGSSRPNSEGNLADDERIAKAEALKKLLGHSPSPKPPGGLYNPYTYDNSRPSPQRHRSGPNTPTHFAPSYNTSSRPAPATPPSGNFPFRDIITAPTQRPSSSKLRQEMSPPFAGPPMPHATVYGNGTPSPSRTPRPADSKRLEDDLRRVLKLDASG